MIPPFAGRLEACKVRMVIGAGPRDAKLVIVGEALGEQEVLAGAPFVGPAGYMLNDALRAAKIDSKDVYITNVIPFRPPNNDIKRINEYGIELEECEEWIREYVGKLQPNCILTLGNVALHALTGLDGITEWRGSILRGYKTVGCKVIPSFHPAHILRMAEKTAKKERENKGATKYTYGSARITLILDAKRAARESQNFMLKQRDRRLDIEPSHTTIMETLTKMYSSPYIAFDIETTKDLKIKSIAFADSANEAIFLSDVDLADVTVRMIVARIFQDHRGLIAQNGTFDMTVLGTEGLPVQTLRFDTMIAHHILYPELPHDLHYLTSVYTDEPFYKWMRESTLESQQREYNCLDACTTFEVFEKLHLELWELGQAQFFYDFVMPLFHLVLKMGWQGVTVDPAKIEEMRATLAKKIEENTKKFGELAGTPSININSHKQMCELLYGKHGFQKQWNKDTGKVTVNAEAIKKLAKKTKHPMFVPLQEVKKDDKLLNTYVNAKLDADSKLRTQYNTTGTVTLRLSASKTLWGTGVNMQTIPPFFKEAIIPQPGHVLVEADLKQAEFLIVLWLAQEEEGKNAVKTGLDIHRWVASKIFEVDYDAVTEDQRYIAKRVVHGSNYGLGPVHFAENTGLHRRKAEKVQQTYFNLLPRIQKWHAEVRDQLVKTKSLIAPSGWKRMFFGRLNEDLFRKGYAHVPQHTCVFVSLRGMLKIAEWRLPLLQSHDSVLLEVPVSEVEKAKQVIQEAYSEPIVIHGDPLVIPVEIKVFTKNWKEKDDGEVKTDDQDEQ